MEIDSRTYLLRTVAFTTLSLVAFAANSVLCRMALGADTIDAPSFTAVRLLTGSIVLLAILGFRGKRADSSEKGSWVAGAMLFLYAATFSFAYVTLDTGTGALILFGSVQITMILLTLLSGTRMHVAEWIGVSIAFFGFVYLILPGATAPSSSGFILMTVAGIAWGIYTLKGRGSTNPLRDTAHNFIKTVPFVVLLIPFAFRDAHYTTEGILLAALSGGIASGIGYTLWYTALGGLSATLAAVLQLLVPVIAAFGGVLFVSETISMRLIISAAMILGGILMVVLGRYLSVQSRH